MLAGVFFFQSRWQFREHGYNKYGITEGYHFAPPSAFICYIKRNISTHTPRMKSDTKPINPICLLYHGSNRNTRGSLLFLSLPQIQVL